MQPVAYTKILEGAKLAGIGPKMHRGKLEPASIGKLSMVDVGNKILQKLTLFC